MSYDFVSFRTQDVLEEVVSIYEGITGNPITPASPEMLFCAWVADIVIHERAILNDVANQNVPSSATGENLDRLAEIYYTKSRPEAKSAECEARFYLSMERNTDIIIPAGTRVTDVNQKLYWATDRDYVIQAGETYADGTVICMTPGEVGNGYLPGQINMLVDLYPYASDAENITESGGGSNVPSDEEFRKILTDSMDAFSTAGSRGSYEYHAKRVSSAISDVKVIRPSTNISKVYDIVNDSDNNSFVFLAGDFLLESLKIRPYGLGVYAVEDVDYTVEYEGMMLKINIIPGKIFDGYNQAQIQITDYAAGRVNIYALMDDGEPASDTVKNLILDACNEDKVRPITDLVSVEDPVSHPFNVAFTYYYPIDTDLSISEIESRVQAATERYVKWQTGRMGIDINPSKLIHELMQTGIKRVVVSQPTYTVVSDGTDGNVPGYAVFGTSTITNGGAEEW